MENVFIGRKLRNIDCNWKVIISGLKAKKSGGGRLRRQYG